MKIPQKKDLIKISDLPVRQTGYIWEIPKSFREDMRVPARIFASEEMINELLAEESTSIWQLINLATLPGVYKYSLAMPDIHSGYGSPVGGVVAFLKEEGIISPGICGYDINCLHPESKILTELGYYLLIKKIKKIAVPLINKNKKELKKGEISLVLRRKENNFLYSIKTKLGYEIKVTSDHPIYTSEGMVEAKKLKEGDKVIIYPFKGIRYQKPKHTLLIDEKDINKAFSKLDLNDGGNAHKQITKWLKERKLIPLYLDDQKIPYLIKILGYVIGDGSIIYLKKSKKLYTVFYGRKEDILEIQKDLKRLNVNSKIYARRRIHKLTNVYGENYEFEYQEFSLKVSSTAFSLLLHLLGAPIGKKIEKEFNIPKWLKKSSLWCKRLFLTSFFGAELSTPKTISGLRFNFYAPTLNINKSIKLQKNGIKFMKEIKNLLKEFGVETSDIKVVKKLGIENKTIGIRFQVKSELNNLLKFFETIGFEYNKEKQKLACLGAAYLRYKKKIIEERKSVREKVRALFKQGVPVRELVATYSSSYINRYFIEHSVWSNRGFPRIAFSSLSFKDFVKEYSFGKDGFIVDEIAEIKKENYQGYVYDLTINDENHNFIANSFIVSNCGVRLLVSPFYYEEIKEKIPKLTEQIFKEVPSGVGQGGFWRLNNDEMNKVLSEGSKWLYEIGYAQKEDLEATESYGKLEGADPDKVSKTAKDRGRDQLGTIGAGNHFVEIQRVAEVFDEEIAKKLGLEKNKVCVLIHCGSRGLGHQVATDYIKEALRYLDRKNIELVDRELAYFPYESEEGKNYLSAMKAAANFAFANRQLIAHEVRKAFKKVFGKDIELKQVYDVAHNIVKEEVYDGKKLLVHRKGATRSFPAGNPELPQKYQEIGQPTLIPGSMGTSSYVLIGLPSAMEISFGSSPHGAGRMMSRTEAKKKIKGSELKKELESRGISVAAGSMSGLAEEAPTAYKDVSQVVDVVHNIGIAKKIVKLVPIGVIKG
jgi:tRNA-splicing ligase RtcB